MMREENSKTKACRLHPLNEAQTLQLGAKFARALGSLAGGWLIFLEGELGAGKSSFVRGFLLGRGWKEAVPSPSFSLREDYSLPDGACVAHLDLYRLKDPLELNYLGLEELWNSEWTVMVEWPAIGENYLPSPDFKIEIVVPPSGLGREFTLWPMNERAAAVLEAMG